jgi:hypothetical protein
MRPEAVSQLVQPCHRQVVRPKFRAASADPLFQHAARGWLRVLKDLAGQWACGLAILAGFAKMSRSVFAAALNVSTKLVQSWEQGTRKPDRGELRLIEILIKQPDIVSNLILANEPARSTPKSSRNGKSASRKRASAA